MLKDLNSHDEEQLENFTKVTMKLFEAYESLARFAKQAKSVLYATKLCRTNRHIDHSK